MSNKKILGICAGILLLAAAVTYLIFKTEPTAGTEAATKEMAMLVEVQQVKRGSFRPVFVATGTVEPVEDVMLSPLVEGQIIHRSPEFSPGGFVQKGALLLQIDPSDYQNNLELRKSDLLQAQTDLEMEMGRQEVAQQDLQLAGGDSLSPQEQALVLRKPQLNAIKGNVKAAQAAVEQARLELERTQIRAPFNAHVLTQNVTVGSQVAPGDNLGRLVGSESYRVNLALPVSRLQWLSFPASDQEKGSPVKIRNTSAWPEGVFRTGHLSERIGALDDQTRLARVLVSLPDPLAHQTDQPPVMIGAFVEAHIQAAEIQDVVRLDRDLVHNGQTVWVMEDGKLSIRKVDIVLTDARYAYIREGLEDQELVVTTNLSTVSEGIALRTATDSIGETQ